MKLNKIFNISAGIALILGATACSGDYLDLKPEGTLEYEAVLTNEEGASLAVNGMCQAMYKQWSSISDGSLGFNGEPEMLQYYGEVMGQDYVSIYWMGYGGQTLMSWTQMNSSDYSGALAAWAYCYNLISQANNLLTFTPKVLDEDGNETEEEFGVGTNTAFNPVPDINGLYAFRYAQALTFRAHAYIHLLQIYCARYEDRFTSNGDWSLTVPLRLKYQEPEGDLNCPLATWEELVNQIYADLDQALTLYQESGARRSNQWEPDMNVAKGLLARVAMINHDWDTAYKMAGEARADYPLMSSDEYQQGFAIPNSEWMWTNSGEFQAIYFWSYGATYACNGAYPCRWGTIGAGGINNDLIKETDAYDLRAALYFSPRNVAGDLKIKFWNRDDCQEQTMDINYSTNSTLHQQFVTFCTNRYRLVSEFGWDPPYTYYGAPLSSSYTTCAAVFGAQFKFWGTDNYSSSFYPFMRASEMLLIQAEAAYEMGEEKTADDLLRELNVKRYSEDRNGNTRYKGSYSGAALYEAIKLFRRMELWGEGFNWFDFKRWNEPIVRRAWAQGDQNSGNWPERYAMEFSPEESNGWRWRIPKNELNYNRDINYSQATTGYDW